MVGRLLRADEVSRALGVGRSKTYEMMAAGTLPTVRIGRAIRVPSDALDEWVQRQIVPAVKQDDGNGGE